MKYLLLFTALASASYLQPPVLPLFIRGPYFSLWYNARAAPWENWPIFWTGQEIGFSVLARVSQTNTVFPLVGRSQDALIRSKSYTVEYPTFHGFQYDASTTNLSYSLGSEVDVTLVFTSPITANSTVRQALPASYLEVVVQGSVDVDVVLEVDGMWVTHDRDADIEGNLHLGKKLNSWAIETADQWVFREIEDRAQWGTLYFSGPADNSVTYGIGGGGVLAHYFAENSKLADNRRIQSHLGREGGITFGISKHFALGDDHSGSKTDSALFTIALIQDPVAQFSGAQGLKSMKPLWKSYHKNDLDMLNYHYTDYPFARAMGTEYADKVIAHAKAIVSDTYADIVSLSARQVMGATVFSGTPENIILFLKEISSNGNFQTVDVIFPAHTFFLYTNPLWLGYLLEPLLEHQEAGLYPNNYSMHDLGAHFPNATGHPDGRDEPMPVEECGNMLAMSLAYVQSLSPQAAQTWLTTDSHYTLLKRWAHYLTTYGLIPAYQLSTDDFAGRLANQTNLAMKALVGIRAMSELAAIVNNTADADYYASIGEAYVPQWLAFSHTGDEKYTNLAYHLEGSWGTLYNIFPDSLLCFSRGSPPFIPHSVYRQQSTFYSTQLNAYGIPLDSRHTWTKLDWELWAAAVSSKSTRDAIVATVGKWINETDTDRPLTDLYDTVDGDWPGVWFMARPVVGGAFAALTLDDACGGDGVRWMAKVVFGESKDGGGGGQSKMVVGGDELK